MKMHFANGSLLGTVYYWDINVGRIRKIQDGTATATDPIPHCPRLAQWQWQLHRLPRGLARWSLHDGPARRWH